VRPQKHPKNAHAHRKMASLTARNRLFHDIVPDFRDRPAMENRVRFSYASREMGFGEAVPDPRVIPLRQLKNRSQRILGAIPTALRPWAP